MLDNEGTQGSSVPSPKRPQLNAAGGKGGGQGTKGKGKADDGTKDLRGVTKETILDMLAQLKDASDHEKASDSHHTGSGECQ